MLESVKSTSQTWNAHSTAEAAELFQLHKAYMERSSGPFSGGHTTGLLFCDVPGKKTLSNVHLLCIKRWFSTLVLTTVVINRFLPMSAQCCYLFTLHVALFCARPKASEALLLFILDSYFVFYNVYQLFVGRKFKITFNTNPLSSPKCDIFEKIPSSLKANGIEKEASLATLWNIWGCPSILSLHCSCLWDWGEARVVTENDVHQDRSLCWLRDLQPT